MVEKISMADQIRAVIFDFGGVLVRTENERLRRDWEQKLNITQGELANLIFESDISVKATLGLATESAIWENLAKKLDIDSDKLAELRSDFWKNDNLDEILVQYVLSLRDRYTTCILSNAWTDARRLFIDIFHLDRVFDKMFISAEIGLAKPDQRIYEYVASALKIRTGEIIFVDDNSENIAGANNAGMHAIQFFETRKLLEELQTLLGI